MQYGLQDLAEDSHPGFSCVALNFLFASILFFFLHSALDTHCYSTLVFKHVIDQISLFSSLLILMTCSCFFFFSFPFFTFFSEIFNKLSQLGIHILYCLKSDLSYA